jgi:hypothetical protein
MQMKSIFILISAILFWTCSKMDDHAIPMDQYGQVEISDFEVNMERDYIRGKIQNNGEHDITSSIFNLEIYSRDSESVKTSFDGENHIVRYTGVDSLEPSRLLLSQNFVVREPLKPGYSTEFYFELKMDYEVTGFLYTYEIIQIKGR